MDHNIFQDSVLPCQLTHQFYPSVDLSLSTLYSALSLLIWGMQWCIYQEQTTTQQQAASVS